MLPDEQETGHKKPQNDIKRKEKQPDIYRKGQDQPADRGNRKDDKNDRENKKKR